jgi:hypothetical protein
MRRNLVTQRSTIDADVMHIALVHDELQIK